MAKPRAIPITMVSSWRLDTIDVLGVLDIPDILDLLDVVDIDIVIDNGELLALTEPYDPRATRTVTTIIRIAIRYRPVARFF